MPNRPRLFLPNTPLHIVQRGHDRNAIFSAPKDYRYYLENLTDERRRLNVKLFAYCLMTNHVHLIIAPGARVENVSRLMKVVGGRQTRYFNRLENRSGTLWEGRFKASLIDSDAYLLACYRYVDLNPVRASMVDSPADYQWSSYREHVDLDDTTYVDESSTFLALAQSRQRRRQAYESFVSQGIKEAEIATIRDAVQRNQLTGNPDFVQQIEKQTGRRIESRGQGRPIFRK